MAPVFLKLVSRSPLTVKFVIQQTSNCAPNVRVLFNSKTGPAEIFTHAFSLFRVSVKSVKLAICFFLMAIAESVMLQVLLLLKVLAKIV